MNKKGIRTDSFSFTTHYLRMIPDGGDEIMSTGTGFIWEHEDMFYLITNGHNVTRLNPENGERITKSIAFPKEISTKVKQQVSKDAFALSNPVSISLYEDEDFLKPVWYIHPQHGYKVDVVAIPIEKIENVPTYIKLFPINKMNFDSDFELEVADDVFILGYPYDLNGGKEFPIWKRGSIATEPVLNIDNLPKYLVDTATKSGMSGSPVIMYRHGYHSATGKGVSGDDIFGRIQVFAGIYSGRIKTNNELDPQLGIIWKPSVIDEILQSKVLGTIEFQNK